MYYRFVEKTKKNIQQKFVFQKFYKMLKNRKSLQRKFIKIEFASEKV